MFLKVGTISGMAFGILMTHAALGATLDLGVKATGRRAPPPAWYDQNNASITNLSFNFTGRTTAAGAAVDSATQSVKLVDDLYQAPANLGVTFTSPKSCAIGTQALTGSPFLFVEGTTETSDGGTVNFTSGQLKTFFLRLPASLNLGDKAGDIACNDDGKLSYSY